MKKLLSFATFIALAMITHADISLPKETTLADKLGRGLGNIIGAPGEVIDSYLQVTQEQGPIAGITKGLLFQGGYRMITDIGHGFYDLATGPLPVGPYYSYQSWKKPANNSSLVQEYPPSIINTDYLF